MNNEIAKEVKKEKVSNIRKAILYICTGATIACLSLGYLQVLEQSNKSANTVSQSDHLDSIKTLKRNGYDVRFDMGIGGYIVDTNKSFTTSDGFGFEGGAVMEVYNTDSLNQIAESLSEGLLFDSNLFVVDENKTLMKDHAKIETCNDSGCDIEYKKRPSKFQKLRLTK